MENFPFGDSGQESHTANLSQQESHPGNESNDDYVNFPTADFYDEGGNYRLDAFESLGGLHYMNYLHSHDDML